MDDLTEDQIRIIDSGHCPDCGHRGFVFGPRGGMSTNIECGNLDCRARFNVAQRATSHHVVFGHRIPKQSEGGSDWSRDDVEIFRPKTTTLQPRSGFSWRRVKWEAPNERRTRYCSYCGAKFPDEEDDPEFVPLVLRNADGWCAEFCNACQEQWWGLQT